MNTKVLGLACLATLSAPAAWALETELQFGPNEFIAGVELMNQHWSPGMSGVINPSATGHASLDARWFDVGFHLDGYQALDGNPGGSDAITDFETTEITVRLDYLFEMQDYFQILPFVECSSYPYYAGRTKFNWIGVEGWYLTPLSGLEVGGSSQYNVADNTLDGINEHYWLHNVGARYFYQEGSLDISAWSLVGFANRAYHLQLSGEDKQGDTTFNMGGQLTLPLPWDATFAFFKVDNFWYTDSEVRKALALAGRDKTELVFSLGFEFRP